MKVTQQIFQKIFIISMIMTSLLLTTSCNDDDNDNLGALEIKVILPKDSKMKLEGLKATLLNITNNEKLSATVSQNGLILVNNLPEGTYNLSIDEKRDEINITGTLSGILITRSQTAHKELQLKLGIAKAGLVIKQLYYSGSNEPNYAIMFKDQFIEIHNNSSETVYADGLYIANLHGTSGYSKGRASYIVSKQYDITKKVYAIWIAQIPGTGKQYPVEPGKSISIAFNAIDFTKETNASGEKYTVLNLANVALETYATDYLQARGKQGFYYDQNNPDVPNLKIHYLASDACYWDMSGTSAVLFRSEKAPTAADVVSFEEKDNNKTTEVKLIGIAVEKIIDGVDFLGDAKAKDYKRLPSSIDNSFFYLKAEGDGSLTGKGMLRKIDSDISSNLGYTVYKDTDNSSVDFKVVKPQI